MFSKSTQEGEKGEKKLKFLERKKIPKEPKLFSSSLECELFVPFDLLQWFNKVSSSSIIRFFLDKESSRLKATFKSWTASSKFSNEAFAFPLLYHAYNKYHEIYYINGKPYQDQNRKY